MYITDDKVLAVTNELIINIEENFYFLDVEFDNTNCNLVFCEIGKLFAEKNKLELLKIELYSFTRECYRNININEKNTYLLFYDNLDILLSLDFITEEDITKLKIRIMNDMAINSENKQLVLTSVS